MTRILAIDPGSERSAWLLWDGRVVDFGLEDNDSVLAFCRQIQLTYDRDGIGAAGTVKASPDVVVIEQMRGFLRTAGLEVFETCRWAGRFEEAAHPTRVELLGRKEVVTHLTGSARSGDVDVRAALIDRFGGVGGKAAAIGLKASPGPLFGISKDVWSALAIALTWADSTPETPERSPDERA